MTVALGRKHVSGVTMLLLLLFNFAHLLVIVLQTSDLNVILNEPIEKIISGLFKIFPFC